ncbi:ORM1-like protein 3 [Tanacetum coccineum]
MPSQAILAFHLVLYTISTIDGVFEVECLCQGESYRGRVRWEEVKGELERYLGEWYCMKTVGNAGMVLARSSGSGLTADSLVLTLTLAFLDFGLDFAQSFPFHAQFCHFGLLTYQFFHWKKGTPFADDQGIYNRLTWWEQIDSGKQLTRNRKFLTLVPVVLTI